MMFITNKISKRKISYSKSFLSIIFLAIICAKDTQLAQQVANNNVTINSTL